MRSPVFICISFCRFNHKIMKFLFSFLMVCCSFLGMAEEELLIKKPLADFIMASLEKDKQSAGFITFLKTGIDIPDNIDVADVEEKLQTERLKRAGRRALTQEELSRISSFMTDTAMYERDAIIDQDLVATVCPALVNPEYDVIIEFKGVSGGKVVICLSATHNHYSFIYADYSCVFYLANTCFNSNAYLSLGRFLQERKENK